MRRADWLIEQRRSAPDEGAAGRAAPRSRRPWAPSAGWPSRPSTNAATREARLAAARAGLERCDGLVPAAERLAAALATAVEAVGDRVAALEAELSADRAAGEGLAGELRAFAHGEADLQGRLRERGEAVTVAEVRAQQARDQAAEAEASSASWPSSSSSTPSPPTSRWPGRSARPWRRGSSAWPAAANSSAR